MKEISIGDIEHSLKKMQTENEITKTFDKKEKLLKKINNALKNESNLERTKILNHIKNMPDFFEDDFQQKEWLFNNGNLRSLNEIEFYNQSIKDINYYNTQWNTDCRTPRICKALILFTILFPIFSLLSGNIPLLLICLPITLLVLIINLSLLLSHQKKVIKTAETHNIPKSDKKLGTIKAQYHSSIIASVFATLSIGKSMKNGLAEISCPDKWDCHI